MGIYEAVKDALKVAQASDNAPLIRDLTAALVAAAEVSAENIQLKERIRELEGQLKQRAALQVRQGILWIEGDDQPICRHCWETTQRTIHLREWGRSTVDVEWRCAVCRNQWVEKLT